MDFEPLEFGSCSIQNIKPQYREIDICGLVNNYVIETSSNLNENPKMEQFSWENDRGLFDWYKKLFIELLSDQE